MDFLTVLECLLDYAGKALPGTGTLAYYKIVVNHIRIVL
jgi:hypothetical protein